MKSNVKDFVAIICCLVAIFIIGSLLFGWKVGIGFVIFIHLFGMCILLANFLIKPYTIRITIKKSGEKVKVTGIKKFIFCLGLSFIWEYLILKNSPDE